MSISIIVAISKNGVIGKNNELPWYVPEDLKRFKALTMGKIVVMGRKTFESIMKKLGHPLPGRKNIVVSRNQNYCVPDDVIKYTSFKEFLKKHEREEIFVIGGGEIYALALSLTGKLFITWIHKEIDGDVFFPKIDWSLWNEISREDHHEYTFSVYERKKL